MADNLYEEIQREFACDHISTQLRKRTARNGAVSYVYQCLRCGDKAQVVKGADLTSIQRGAAPDFDEPLRREWNERRWAEMERRRNAVTQQESQQWWSWYNEYLASPEWRNRRQRVLDRDDHQCKACEIQAATQVHHLTYRHVGQEPLFDLVAVCERCHVYLTALDRAKRAE